MKVVSGGQTGVDRAALDAALAAGLPVGGVVPKGRLAEDGVVPLTYPMEECGSEDYAVRNEINVQRSDATLILNRGRLAGGTQLTQAFCRKHKKAVRVVEVDSETAAEEIRDFLKQNRPAILNVAGPRESKAPGIYARAREVLSAVFNGL